MKIGTRSVLFGVHQFILHPIFVLMAWLIIYHSWPKFHEFCAILTHDLGYFGQPNMDGDEGEDHPEIVANWWRKHCGAFGDMVALEILGHSRFHAKKNDIPLSKLFRPDKLSTALYPKFLYLLLGNLSGEIREYMNLTKNGKYDKERRNTKTQIQWLIEVQAHCALMGIEGEENRIVKRQMKTGEKQ